MGFWLSSLKLETINAEEEMFTKSNDHQCQEEGETTWRGETLEYFNVILFLVQNSLSLPSGQQHKPQSRVKGWIFKRKV